MSPETIIVSEVHPQLELGEGPHWDETTQSLYFVDIWKSTIYRYVPGTDEYYSTKFCIPGEEKKPVSFIIPVENEEKKFVISHGVNIVLISWDGVSNIAARHRILAKAAEDPKKLTRINDGKCSPSGVLFAGTMALANERIEEKLGKFYSFENLKSKLLFDSVGVSNGLAWSQDEKTLYYIDSLTKIVKGFEYNAKDATITNEQKVFDFSENGIPGYPDGMTIDTDGYLWIACYEGSRVIKVDPRKKTLEQTILFRTPNITSVAFGGKNLDELYVTSARYETFTSTMKDGDDEAGCVFKVTGTGSKGLPGVPINISCVQEN